MFCSQELNYYAILYLQAFEVESEVKVRQDAGVSIDMLNSQLKCRNAGFAVPQTTLRSTIANSSAVGCEERETEWNQRRNGRKGFVRKLVDSAADIVLAAFAIAFIVVLLAPSAMQ